MEKIKHLLNTDTQRFIILGGLQGGGKTTLAQEFIQAGYEIVSPDIERYELAKQEYGEEKRESQLQHVLENFGMSAWKRCETKVFDFLKEGKSVVFDATLTTPKARRKIKAWSEKAKIDIKCVYIDVSKETAINRNDDRGRTIIEVKNDEPIFGRHVPDYVIEDKFTNQALPLQEEGFDEIIILSELIKDRSMYHIDSILKSLTDDVRGTVEMLKQSDTLKDIFPHLDKCWGIEQNNHHHTQALEEHMIRAAEIIVEKYKDEVSYDELVLLVVTALNHDVGKKDTKEFYGIMLDEYEGLEKNEKVVVKGKNEFGVIIQRQLFKGFFQTIVPYYMIKFDENAHFYGHENVGATQTRRTLLELGLDEKFSNEVYALILHHMRLPYQDASNKSLTKFIRTVGEGRVENLLRIRYADKKSSGTQKNFDENFNKLKVQLKTILSRKGDPRMKLLVVGNVIRFENGAYKSATGNIVKIENGKVYLENVIYDENQELDKSLVLPVNQLRNIELVK